MSEQACLRKKIEVAENTLKHTDKLMGELLETPLWKRDSEQNRRLVELSIIRNRLEKAIEIMKFDEQNVDHVHVDIQEPLESNNKKTGDSAYLE